MRKKIKPEVLIWDDMTVWERFKAQSLGKPIIRIKSERQKASEEFFSAVLLCFISMVFLFYVLVSTDWRHYDLIPPIKVQIVNQGDSK